MGWIHKRWQLLLVLHGERIKSDQRVSVVLESRKHSVSECPYFQPYQNGKAFEQERWIGNSSMKEADKPDYLFRMTTSPAHTSIFQLMLVPAYQFSLFIYSSFCFAWLSLPVFHDGGTYPLLLIERGTVYRFRAYIRLDVARYRRCI